jgi:hypothetical protein
MKARIASTSLLFNEGNGGIPCLYSLNNMIARESPELIISGAFWINFLSHSPGKSVVAFCRLGPMLFCEKL